MKRSGVSGELGQHVDLQSVRMTLEYIHGDVKQVRHLSRVAAALQEALSELDAVGCRGEDPALRRLLSLPGGRQLR